jgi:hypothetical protein
VIDALWRVSARAGIARMFGVFCAVSPIDTFELLKYFQRIVRRMITK